MHMPVTAKGDALYTEGKYDEAIKAYDEAIKSYHNSVVYLFN
jgi:predicted negative regulator of RcsB-dependent stress response